MNHGQPLVEVLDREGKIRDGVKLILEGLDLDLSDDNLKDTPDRVVRAYAEILGGLRDTKEQVQRILSSAFPCKADEMVLQKGIRAFSLCPHHLLPVDYVISVAYIPSTSVIGLSKLARLVDLLARRPVLQEQLVTDVTEALMSIDGCRGAACVAAGRHYCMTMRGIRASDSTTMTSSMRGVFRAEPAARAEFLSLANNLKV